MPADLLFEVGVEEIPAAALERALAELGRQLPLRLVEARLAHGAVHVLGTPRRLAVLVLELEDRQRDLSEEVVGPPARVAFDATGAPTKAAIGFAERSGVQVSALERREVEGKKGEYVVCTRREAGKPASEILAALLHELLVELPWAKSMRWGAGEQPFVRPVRWLVARLGTTTLPLEFAGIRAGTTSLGHRFLAPEPIEVTAESYREALRKAFVIVSAEVRRDMVRAELARIAEETGLVVRVDDRLVAEVANLVEYPVGVCGEFDAGFLEVPEEVIVSAMRAHQRYFAMEDASGALANRFVTIAGTITRSPEVVRRGNQRVLAARLADAQFFFREDRKQSLASWGEKLADVVFQSKLGSIGDKVGRVKVIASRLAERLAVDPAAAARVAELAKADLVTHMVFEFPELQGVMGRHYARASGEPSDIADGIFEHYLPRGASDALPSGALGAVVGVADRLDTLVGCFAAGLQPTGSADPYGLRRAALAILAILLERGWTVPLTELVELAAGELSSFVPADEACRNEVLSFLRTRFKGLLVEGSSLPADCVDAAMEAGFVNVPDTRARAQAVASLRARPDFEPLAVAFKRVANILKDAWAGSDPDPERFVADAERELWKGFGDIESRASACLGSGDYRGSLQILAELKTPVDRFFDAVLVMDEDEGVRANRLALLGRINATFTRIADFRQLAV